MRRIFMFTEEEMQAIQKIVTIIDNSSLRSGTFEKDGFVIQFNKDHGTYSYAPAAPKEGTVNPFNTDLVEPATEAIVESDTDLECKAPFLGTLYLQSNDEEKSAIHIGQKVKKGEVLFLIEAMKLLNEVHAPADGEITEILCNHGDLVQFGDVVIRMKASDLND